jgi:hypothetical protein
MQKLTQGQRHRITLLIRAGWPTNAHALKEVAEEQGVTRPALVNAVNKPRMAAVLKLVAADVEAAIETARRQALREEQNQINSEIREVNQAAAGRVADLNEVGDYLTKVMRGQVKDITVCDGMAIEVPSNLNERTKAAKHLADLHVTLRKEAEAERDAKQKGQDSAKVIEAPARVGDPLDWQNAVRIAQGETNGV